MALDDLQGVIEKLQQIIKVHRDYLSRHETRTRQVLIDPLLRELGWDVSDPAAVELEYSVKLVYKVGKKWADYTLMFKDELMSDADSKPVAVIEAKPLGSDLNDDKMMQALNYANRDAINYMIVTDGNKWEMYEVFKQAALEERLLMKLELSQKRLAHKNAMEALAMWKPNLTSKEPVFISPKSQQLSDDTSTGGDGSDEGEGEGKKSATRLVVTMLDGEKIDHDDAIETFADVIQKLGINKVRSVYPGLISTSKSSKHGYQIDQHYIRHRTGTDTKKHILEKVAGRLGERLKVEIVLKN